MEVQSALSLYDIQSRVPNLITFFEKLVRGVKIIPDIRANMTGISINVMEDCPFSSNKMIRPEYSVGNEVYLFKDEPLGSLQESLIRPHDVFDYRNLAFEIRHVEKVMAPQAAEAQYPEYFRNPIEGRPRRGLPFPKLGKKSFIGVGPLDFEILIASHTYEVAVIPKKDLDEFLDKITSL